MRRVKTEGRGQIEIERNRERGEESETEGRGQIEIERNRERVRQRDDID